MYTKLCNIFETTNATTLAIVILGSPYEFLHDQHLETSNLPAKFHFGIAFHNLYFQHYRYFILPLIWVTYI